MTPSWLSSISWNKDVRSTACLSSPLRVSYASCFWIGEAGDANSAQDHRRRQNPMMRLHLCRSSYEDVHRQYRAKGMPDEATRTQRRTTDEERSEELRGAGGAMCGILQELVEDNAAGGGDVQRLLEAQHRNAHPVSRTFQERCRQAIDFVAEHEAHGERRRPVEQIYGVERRFNRRHAARRHDSSRSTSARDPPRGSMRRALRRPAPFSRRRDASAAVRCRKDTGARTSRPRRCERTRPRCTRFERSRGAPRPGSRSIPSVRGAPPSHAIRHGGLRLASRHRF